MMYNAREGQMDTGSLYSARAPSHYWDPNYVSGPGNRRYTSTNSSYGGYSMHGRDARSTLMDKWQRTEAEHRTRIQNVTRMLGLWAGKELVIYPKPRQRDDEIRLRVSKPFKIVDVITSLVWNKPPILQIANTSYNPTATAVTRRLETALGMMAEQYKIWRAVRRGVFWSVVGGAGPIDFFYDAFAMDDEPLLVVRDLDPRYTVWKESIRNDGTCEYSFTVQDELASDVMRRYGLTSLGDGRSDEQAARDPMYRIRVYTYWCEERERQVDPMTGQGRPIRYIVNAVFTDWGFLREPEVMQGYTRVPTMIVRGADYPLEHEDLATAYMPALWPVEDELKTEAQMQSALLTNVQWHMDPATNVWSNDVNIGQRVSPERGGLNRLRPEEKLEAFQKSTVITRDTEMAMLNIDKQVQGATIPEAFQGTMDLGDVSGVALSVINTVPLLRLAVRQQFVEDTLERFLPSAISCLARHSFQEGRRLRFTGRNPRDQEQFLDLTVDPDELLDPDLRIVVKLSSSLPRDAMNEATLMMNAQRMGLIDKYTTRAHILKLFDVGVTDPDEVERRIVYEAMREQMLQRGMFGALIGEDGGMEQAGPQPGELPNQPQQFTDEAYQSETANNVGPLDSMVTERSPGMRFSPEMADNVTGRGQTALTNPLLARRRAAADMTRAGGMMFPPQTRRQ